MTIITQRDVLMYAIGLIDFLGYMGKDTVEQREKLGQIISGVRLQYMPKTNAETILKVVDELRSQNLIEFMTAIMKDDFKKTMMKGLPSQQPKKKEDEP